MIMADDLGYECLGVNGADTYQTPHLDRLASTGMRFTNALKKHPRLDQIKDFIIDYFKLYQRAYGMFQLDYDNFKRAIPDAEYHDACTEVWGVMHKLQPGNNPWKRGQLSPYNHY